MSVTVCILDSENSSLECVHPDGKEETLPLEKANNYICMSPDDTQKLLNQAHLKCSKE